MNNQVDPFNQAPKGDEQDQTKKYVPSTGIITNTLILILFFFTFCQIKSCNGNFQPVSGYRLAAAGLLSITNMNLFVFFFISLGLLAAIIGLVVILINSPRSNARCGLWGFIGALAITLFIFTILIAFNNVIKMKIPLFIVLALHIYNSVYYLIILPREKPK